VRIKTEEDYQMKLSATLKLADLWISADLEGSALKLCLCKTEERGAGEDGQVCMG
jgi:hypothetical protein